MFTFLKGLADFSVTASGSRDHFGGDFKIVSCIFIFSIGYLNLLIPMSCGSLWFLRHWSVSPPSELMHDVSFAVSAEDVVIGGREDRGVRGQERRQRESRPPSNGSLVDTHNGSALAKANQRQS